MSVMVWVMGGAGFYPRMAPLEAYTKGPAWVSFEEDQKGTLTPGKLADVAVFDTDLVKAGRTRPADLLQAKVLYTIVGGKVVYDSQLSRTIEAP